MLHWFLNLQIPETFQIPTALTKFGGVTLAYLKIDSSLRIFYVLIFNGLTHSWLCFVKPREK